jgi:3-deoxy-D-manno-octulosonic-acid transferase
VDYLPPDGRANAERLVRLVQPAMALFVKYEFWPNHLHVLKKAEVPTYLVSAIFRADQPFFRWYGGAWRRMLRCFTHIFTQDAPSFALLQGIGMAHATVSGDTRFDRVARIVEANEDLPVARSFREAAPSLLLICGSTWPADERVLLQALNDPAPAPRIVIAPHEPAPEHLRSIEERFPKPLITWSEAVGDPMGAWAHGHMRTCLVDRMGVLARLYKYGDIAYVGGGFGDGIHSLLEAAAWGRPVIFGPRHTKFAEAQGLIEAGGGFEVRDGAQLASLLHRLLGDPGLLASASKAAARYVQDRRGATDRVVVGLTASGSAPR